MSHYYETIVSSIGVDIFLIVSAIGLYFSYKKNNNLKDFYKKRVIRIVIPYIIICGIYWFFMDIIIEHKEVSEFLKDFFWITFFENHITTFWYIFAIIVFYLIFSILNKIISKTKYGKIYTILIIIFTIILNTLILKINLVIYKNIEIFLLRIPIFVVGTYLARKVYEKDNIEKWAILTNLILLIIILFLKTYHLKYRIINYYYFTRYLTTIFSINICIFIPILLDYIDNKEIKY